MTTTLHYISQLRCVGSLLLVKMLECISKWFKDHILGSMTTTTATTMTKKKHTKKTQCGVKMYTSPATQLLQLSVLRVL